MAHPARLCRGQYEFDVYGSRLDAWLCYWLMIMATDNGSLMTARPLAQAGGTFVDARAKPVHDTL